MTEQTIYNWWIQHLVDTGRRPGTTSTDKAELLAARRRITELETQLAAMRRANELLNEVVPPKIRFDAVETMVSEGHPVEVAAESATYRSPVSPPAGGGHPLRDRSTMRCSPIRSSTSTLLPEVCTDRGGPMPSSPWHATSQSDEVS